MRFKITLLLSLFIYSFSFSQIDVQRNLNLELAEKDSLTSAKLETALRGFLAEAQSGDYSSEYVDPIHQKEFEFFFNKLAGIGKGNHPDFNDPMILKSFTADHEVYQLTVAFTGQKEGVPFIYQITELKAIPYKDHYRFYSPFKDRTANFKTKTIQNVSYHYSGSIYTQKAAEFAEFKTKLATLTNTPDEHLDYYCFASLDELLKSYGFVYSARQCNFLCYDLGFTDSNGKIYVTGTNNENYRFGYIGDYLYTNLPNQESMYWPFVQGLSTYYGGYGLSYENVAELKQQFKVELAKNPQIDFLEEFQKGRKSSINRHFSYYVMSAFLCEAVIKEKGFDGVLKLVYSGADGTSFFTNLKAVLDIDETNFHQYILRVINES